MKKILTNQEIKIISGSFRECSCVCTGGYSIGIILTQKLCILNCQKQGYSNGKCERFPKFDQDIEAIIEYIESESDY